MLQADPSKVSKRAKKRGLPQLGTLGAGNHYCEIQVSWDELVWDSFQWSDGHRDEHLNDRWRFQRYLNLFVSILHRCLLFTSLHNLKLLPVVPQSCNSLSSHSPHYDRLLTRSSTSMRLPGWESIRLVASHKASHNLPFERYIYRNACVNSLQPCSVPFYLLHDSPMICCAAP